MSTGLLCHDEMVHSGRGERQELDAEEYAVDPVATKSLAKLKELLQGNVRMSSNVASYLFDPYRAIFVRSV